MTESLQSARQQMVQNQLRPRGLSDERVLAAMELVPRHVFAGTDDPMRAYGDHPLPIGHGQTISQPYMVARMTELCALTPRDRVLEVGAGSGYQTAVLAELSAHVYACEIVEPLAKAADQRLATLGIDNVTVAHRDGSLGWSEHAPFDAILVAAGAPAVPEPLRDQLAAGGRLVIPVGDQQTQILRCWIQGQEHPLEDTACRFVDLRGEHGWSDRVSSR